VVRNTEIGIPVRLGTPMHISVVVRRRLSWLAVLVMALIWLKMRHVCSGEGSVCGSESTCSGPGSTCGDNSVCSGVNTVCGERSTCSGVNSTCGDESECSGLKSVCGSHSTCTGDGSKCGLHSICSELAECAGCVPAAIQIIVVISSLVVLRSGLSALWNQATRLLPRLLRRRVLRANKAYLTPGQELGDCPICLERLHDREACHTLGCRHSFHVLCLDEWLSRHDTCPICRKAAIATVQHGLFVRVVRSTFSWAQPE